MSCSPVRIKLESTVRLGTEIENAKWQEVFILLRSLEMVALIPPPVHFYISAPFHGYFKLHLVSKATRKGLKSKQRFEVRTLLHPCSGLTYSTRVRMFFNK